MHWQSASDSHRGNYRAQNEDAVFCSSAQRLWAVADGMGGHNAGDYASEVIAQALSDIDLNSDLGGCVDAIEDCLLEVNDHLRHHARLHCAGKTIGSTVVVVVVREHVGVALWAGDSRLYRCRRGQLTQVTRDHNPISDLLDSGAVTEEQALAADTHVITRAVGGQNDLHLDVAVFDVHPGDTLLLCSDGLYREVSQWQLCEALEDDVESAVERLMQGVLAGDARDNVSLVVTRAEHG